MISHGQTEKAEPRTTRSSKEGVTSGDEHRYAQQHEQPRALIHDSATLRGKRCRQILRPKRFPVEHQNTLNTMTNLAQCRMRGDR